MEDRITDNLDEYKSVVEGFAEKARDIMLQDGGEALEEYIGNINGAFLSGRMALTYKEFIFCAETRGRTAIYRSGSSGQFWDYDPRLQSWYYNVPAADGAVIETAPYISNNGETICTFAKEVTDDNGTRIGVACVNVSIDSLGQRVIETALNQGGYGILISQDGLMLFHPNGNFKGLLMYEPVIPLSVYADRIAEGEELLAEPLTAYTGEKAVVFTHTLKNGWSLMLVTPEKQYYQSISNLGGILTLLAIVFAAILIYILIRLDKARVKADEESRQKSMFLANMSHEIRTPMNAIIGMTAIGKTAGSAERKDYCFAKIDDASRHLLGVINDILDISKIEANKIELSPTHFSFEKMLQQAVNVVNFRADEKRQKLTVNIDRQIPGVLYADDQRLVQIVTNILSNAIKFTPNEGSIALKTRFLGEEDGVIGIQIEVSDNGIGMNAEQMSNVFNAFQQAESSTTRQYGGTGLGLSISKNIAEMMGGDIKVKSEVSKGTTFTITVKVKRGDDSIYGLGRAAFNWDDVRILTVDDDRDILVYFDEIISGMGASSEVAEGPAEALRLIGNAGDYNIYFVDFKMPGMNGLELVKEIKSREKKPGGSIIIMISSADLSSVEDEARNAGVNKFLLKPIFPSSIYDTINEYIGDVTEKPEEPAPDITGIFAGKRILFAEDVEINREIILSILEDTGVDIECAENGLIAVQMFADAPDKYDLIFMDIQMPVMDGFEAARQIRANSSEKAKTIPIIAMTANVFKEDIEECLAAGMNEHIGKPLDIERLLSLMTQYLK
ncbi:MAG: response regulator [Clostridiales bacterium]|jgi:signal transduction histidine kinase/DNA-binding response OmpR family regulator|nr:response regulator [Clostridiales bacterium]